MEKVLEKGTQRVWGYYDVLEEGSNFKVKKLVVLPNRRLSLQSHKHRSEVWTIVDGVGIITIGDSIKNYEIGEVAIIPVGEIHRVENNGDKPLTIIEVQYGTYFGEDDITRY
jgi:mannose-6-phosphate isomerase-like protein (cupin superfamily)